MSLDYTNSIPLHVQLKKILEQQIYNGYYTEKLPSERELMDEYYVSRSTVRQSIEQLVRERVLERKPGKGTFVAIRTINDWLGSLHSTSENIEKMGMAPGAKLVASQEIEVFGRLKDVTGLDKAHHFKRVRYADDIPMGIERHYYPVGLGKKLSQYNLDQEAFYELLEKELKVKTFQAEQEIKAGAATRNDAKLLHILEGASIIIAERKITDIHGDFVEFERAHYRADMYSFKITLSRNSK
ncbi:HTH-type transcriptional repressor YvoA [Oceanobacillus oncorhynchi]|uniref:HTH-type transcriptional repressor YvoA n=1 Tax=Oceanobacillus oncorhynchi TaxID=545501 RepID=A0A0A1MM20_9BACI|nr:GntR family transcriptional regulator [Oceanobacillus oncorhynchi]CEI80839.1 HTH-type transcriptional repressor YvoA [Oceanobacillus oncorhynchi]